MRFTFTFDDNLFLKLWVHFGYLFDHPNHDWGTINFPLHLICCSQIQVNRRNYTRGMIGVGGTTNPYKRSFSIFFIRLPPFIPGDILFKRGPQEGLNKGGKNYSSFNSNFFLRLRAPLGTDVILSRSSNYKFAIRDPHGRRFNCNLDLRRIRGQSTNPNSILLATLPTSFYSIVFSFSSFNLPSQ